MIRKFIFKLALFLPIPLVIGGAGLAADPGGLFLPVSYLERIAVLLSANRDIWGHNPNIDERALHKLMFERSSGPVDVMAFGSSRSKGINKNLFPKRSFYNAGVSAGSLEDFIGLYQLLHEKELAPREVIIEASAWMLNPKNNTLHADARTLDAEYARGLARMGLPKPKDHAAGRISRTPVEKIKELFSFPYLKQAVLAMRDSAKKGRSLGYAILSEGSPWADDMVLHADLSWTSPEENRQVTLAEANLGAEYPKGIQDFPRIPEERRKEFEAFIHQLKADKVKVTLYLPPWSEETYLGVTHKPMYKVVPEEERYFLRFAQENGIELAGSYNAADLGLSLKDFSDTEHLRRRVIPKVFEPSVRAAAKAAMIKRLSIT